MVANCFFVLLSLLLPAANDTSFAIYQQNIPGTNVHFKMIPITGGHFVMGSGDAERGRKADEGPAKQVTVGSFWIEEHEVTYDEYIFFADEQLDKDPKPDAITRPSPPYIDFTLGMGKTGGYPANSMSQYAAMAYCHWLYRKTGIFYRLPTEAEWEYAARAGTNTAFFFGEDDTQLDEFAWHAANSGGKYHKVMEKKPNAWGLYDMAGNVAEWTLDQYKADYFEMIKADTIEPWMIPQKKHPVSLRGGAFHDVPDNLRCAARIKSELKWNARDPQIPRSKWWNTDAPFIGFRIVRPKKQPTSAEAENFYVQFLSLK